MAKLQQQQQPITVIQSQQRQNQKQPSEKLQEKIKSCGLAFHDLNTVVNEVIELGKAEGFFTKI